MKILFDSARGVNPARAFGAGIRTAPLPDRPFEPCPEDRTWWAAECDRCERSHNRRRDLALDAMALESAAIDELERGRIPDDGRITDRDVIVATGCCR
jgi:hypothetical protein